MIPYGRQTIEQADIDAVVEVLRSPMLTQGPVVPAFEAGLCAMTGAAHAVAVNSATSGLHIACLALGLAPGDLLWTVPNTFVATANAALYCGASVDFVDIDPRTYVLDVTALELKLEDAAQTGRLPKIVVPVHFAGQSCDMERIAALAKRYKFAVLEDASHAVGAHYLKQPVGDCRYSDICIFSFHPVKTLTTGEGGMLVTDRAEWAALARRLRSHGIEREADHFTEFTAESGSWLYEMQDLGFNYRLTDLQCALGLSQLSRLEAALSRRREIVAAYNAAFAELDWLRVPGLRDPADAATTSWHLYTVQIDFAALGRSRAEVMTALRANGVGSQVHYIPVHLQPWYRKTFGYGHGKCPVAESYYARALSLPLFPAMTEADIAYVIAAVQALAPIAVA